ncbi:hypothetical protein PQX77_021328 [Marasmius sp. AFHP31]|nr:hypothetical protein PQX77_021328 [Marasmius sp. AFHP31]
MYLNWNTEARHLGRYPKWSPDAAYFDFAYTFNDCVESHKLVIPTKEGEKEVLRFVEFPAPPPEELGVEVHQCTDNEQLLPGYISIRQSKYNDLQAVATNAALRESHFRARATREKAERQAQRSSTGRAAGGFSTYIHPDERARQEKKLASSGSLFYNPSTTPSHAPPSAVAGSSSSRKKSRSKKNKAGTDNAELVTQAPSSGGFTTTPSSVHTRSTTRGSTPARAEEPTDDLDDLREEDIEGDASNKNMDTSVDG